MNASDLLGLGAFTLFGVWWIVAPKSVIAVYRWLHKGAVSLPRSSGVRVAGALWVLLMVTIFLAARR